MTVRSRNMDVNGELFRNHTIALEMISSFSGQSAAHMTPLPRRLAIIVHSGFTG
jgi:hypothetical protein